MKKQTTSTRVLGEVLKTFGANGELIIRLNDEFPAKINTKEPVFITIDGLPVPFYFLSFQAKGKNKALVIFDNMETEALAEELVGKTMYTEGKKGKKKEEFSLEQLIGFTVIDSAHGELGEITDFFDYPNNPCFQIETTDKKEILIPVNEDLIEGIDAKGETMYVNLPEGLVSLYLE